MSSIAALSSHPLFHRLGVTLAEFLWQGTIVAAAWAAARAVLARSKSSLRYAVGCAALAAMVALPAATFWKTTAQASTPSAIAAPDESPDVSETDSIAARSLSRVSLSLSQVLRDIERSIEPWPVLIWAAGVLLLSLRFSTGWAAVERLRSRVRAPASAELLESLARVARRMRISRPVQLVESAIVQVPTALGVFRPAILLPLCGLSGLSPAQIEAVLAHELAHIRRHDYFVNLLQTAVETLFFYHPAVWWVSASVRLERENCCDDLAVEATGDPRGYARALLSLEEQRAGAPQLALAATGGGLMHRIARLTRRAGSNRPGPGRAGALLAFAALVALGAAAGGPASSDTLSGTAGSFSDAMSPVLAAMPAPSELDVDSPLPVSPRLARARPLRAVQEAAGPKDASAAKAAQRRTLTAEELEDFQTHGVTPEFLREIEALGYTKASVSTLVSLRIHGVSADYLRRINEVFGEKISLDTAVELRIHGVGPEFVVEMSKLFGRLSPDTAEALRIHGVSPEYVAGFHEQGYPSLSADEAVTLRNHGVDPAAAAEFVKMGFAKPSLDELLTARNHGVSVEYARGIREAGLEIPDLDEMVALRNHGVTPEFVKEMKPLGYARLSADEAIALRNHGVTPEYVRELNSLKYTGLSVDELVALRNHGVTADFARRANVSAGKRLSVEELIDSHNWRRREP